ncbi:hypothetical protein ABEB36_013985 [Hypothenemus hampei]|uniref:Uncharacterized protein n=1 Tax=Hypothenemus hampei TaxID=57062 RepID=A0ABD1E3W5_HYPHA
MPDTLGSIVPFPQAPACKRVSNRGRKPGRTSILTADVEVVCIVETEAARDVKRQKQHHGSGNHMIATRKGYSNNHLQQATSRGITCMCTQRLTKSRAAAEHSDESD